MAQLWLKFKDEKGDEQRVAVEGELFTVGRHSANDLTVTDSRLSREHIRIERADCDYFVSDPGSSNGTTINGKKLSGPENLKDGDLLDLGGGLQITIEIEAAEQDPAADLPEAEAEMSGQQPPAANPPPYAPSPAAAAPANDGIPTSFFILAPLLGIMVLVIVGVLIFLFSGRDKTPDIADSGDDTNYSTSNDDDDTPVKDDDDAPTKPGTSPTPSAIGTPANGGTTTTPSPVSGGTDLPPTNLSETAKVEQNGALFLRRIAQNEPKAFLTGDQEQKVNAKVKQIGKSAVLAENINAARKNAAQIKALAASKNLKPQFLAVAAITKLGSGRGDIIQAAESVADVYDKLATQIGSEFGDDSLLMVAAFDQGAAGDTMKMRNMLQELAAQKNLPAGAREIRSIWFLEKNGKITRDEFNRALNFLAIGTITQNPRDFGVNAEALTL